MATAGIVISADFPDLKKVGDAIRGLGDSKFTAAALKAALAKAIKPAEDRLRQITPVGPTGNLKAAVMSIAKAYPKDGNAVGLIGYRRSGKRDSESAAGGKVRASSGRIGDRGYHQWMIEFGTKPRVVGKFSNTPYQRKSPSEPFVRTRLGKQETVRGSGVPHIVKKGQNAYIASSFKSLGPFELVKRRDGGFVTDPPYQAAYFKKSANPIVIPPTPAGGIAGRPPIRTAFQETQAQVAAILQQEMQISLERAVSTLTFRGQGTISGV
jgi:hypothetical protein